MRPIEEFSYIKNNKVVLDSDSLTQLYLPVIGNQATALYHYLNAFFDTIIVETVEFCDFTAITLIVWDVVLLAVRIGQVKVLRCHNLTRVSL